MRPIRVHGGIEAKLTQPPVDQFSEQEMFAVGVPPICVALELEQAAVGRDLGLCDRLMGSEST